MLTLLEKQNPWAVWVGGAVACVILSVMAYGWVVLPSHERQRDAAVTSEQSRAQSDEAAELEHELEQLGQSLQTQRDVLAQQPQALGNYQELNRQIARLIELAQAHGLEVMQLQPGESSRGDHYDILPLRLEAVAGFSQHLAFLESLHTTFPSISVLGLDLASRAREISPRPEGRYRLVWFTAKPEAASTDSTSSSALVNTAR